jgi:hypothetical protein
LGGKLGVVHTCISSYAGGTYKRIEIHLAWAKKHKTLSKKLLKQKGLEAWLKWPNT